MKLRITDILDYSVLNYNTYNSSRVTSRNFLRRIGSHIRPRFGDLKRSENGDAEYFICRKLLSISIKRMYLTCILPSIENTKAIYMTPYFPDSVGSRLFKVAWIKLLSMTRSYLMCHLRHFRDVSNCRLTPS